MFDNLRKYAAAYAVAIGGVLLTCLSSWNVRQELQTSHFKEFQWAAGDRIQSVRAVVDQGLDALLEIRGLFYAAQGVDEKEFLVFTDSVLKRRPYIDSLLWAPLLTSPRQALPESAPGSMARAAPVAGQAEAAGTLRVPVLLSASRSGTGIARGVDLNTMRELAALFQRARASGNVAVSGRMELARPGGSGVCHLCGTAGLCAGRHGHCRTSEATGTAGIRDWCVRHRRTGACGHQPA
ncbi:MAG: CHASE domain-containing protein [Candidatus Accumulibacter sp.]|nr:CHASE domain-containing protein [Accumulibacter sp.]